MFVFHSRFPSRPRSAVLSLKSSPQLCRMGQTRAQLLLLPSWTTRTNASCPRRPSLRIRFRAKFLCCSPLTLREHLLGLPVPVWLSRSSSVLSQELQVRVQQRPTQRYGHRTLTEFSLPFSLYQLALQRHQALGCVMVLPLVTARNVILNKVLDWYMLLFDSVFLFLCSVCRIKLQRNRLEDKAMTGTRFFSCSHLCRGNISDWASMHFSELQTHSSQLSGAIELTWIHRATFCPISSGMNVNIMHLFLNSHIYSIV